MKDDIKRPYKLYAAVASVVLSSLVADPLLDWNNPWLKALAVASVAGLSVFITPNPKVE